MLKNCRSAKLEKRRLTVELTNGRPARSIIPFHSLSLSPFSSLHIFSPSRSTIDPQASAPSSLSPETTATRSVRRPGRSGVNERSLCDQINTVGRLRHVYVTGTEKEAGRTGLLVPPVYGCGVWRGKWLGLSEKMV
ncbi:hypothetical protein RRG08_013579 [Elysia crispata]|uniref:Uncharacterized protein n=1 Tax=Elysia crispata TaxID=231223 RepID=A0AAE0Y2M7_9GAST|nr:hypothetical protein RRG08_013579 [Elysia crispata]